MPLLNESETSELSTAIMTTTPSTTVSTTTSSESILSEPSTTTLLSNKQSSSSSPSTDSFKYSNEPSTSAAALKYYDEPTTSAAAVAAAAAAAAASSSGENTTKNSSSTENQSDSKTENVLNILKKRNILLSSSDDEDEPKNKSDKAFECNICLDTAKDAVVSLCGHLFCWPCLHQWLETRPLRQLCPVCKAAISAEKVIPLYGRDSGKQEDPRKKTPPRPAGQRTEPEGGLGFQGLGFGDGTFHMSFGIGAFPFGFFASAFNMEGGRPANAAPRPPQDPQEERYLSKLFIYIAIMILTWLIFA